MIISLLLATELLHAGPRVAKLLKTELKGTEFSATVPEGYHFNGKAPNAVLAGDKSIKPNVVEKTKISFIGLPEQLGAASANLFLCDDALTFCESETIKLGAKTSAVTKLAPNPDKGHVNRHGFIQDDLEKAFAQAKPKGKLVLIDFSARWCPSCVRLEKETFPTAEFKKQTADIVKVRLDFDRFENTVLGERYKVTGIPVLIVTNADGEEINRIVDYQSPEIFRAFFRDVRAMPETLAALEAKAAGDPALNLPLGKRLLSANRYEDALKYLNQVQPPPPEKTLAEVYHAEELFHKTNAKTPYVAALKAAIASENSSTRSVRWRADLARVTDEPSAKASLRDEGVRLVDGWLKDRAALEKAAANDDNGEFIDLHPLMVAMYKAELIGSTGANEEETRKAWEDVARFGLEQKISPKRTGSAMRFLLTLMRAKMYPEAEKFALAMLKEDPNNPELQRRYFRTLVELKRYKEAEPIGRRVLAKSYGMNEFWVATAMAKLLIETKQTAAARKLIDTYLARPEIGWASVAEERKTLEELRSKT